MSTAARAALYAPQTSAVFLDLLTIDHDDMDAPVHFVNNLTDITSNGSVFTAFPFQAVIPPDVEGELPQIDLVVDNVTRDLIADVRSISTPASVTLEVIIASAPDTIEAGPFLFQVTAAEYDAQEIRLSLTSEPLMQEPYPYRLFIPGDFPLLFKAVPR